jgi:AcrR family transcriptional regulator
MNKKSKSEQENRQIEILDAGLYCFLKFGFAKTSMNDIAKQANLSRPLIYLLFPNKIELLKSLFEKLLMEGVDRAEHILQAHGSRKDKLTQAVESMILQTWNRISGHPCSLELFESCSLHNQENYEKFEKKQLKILEVFFGDRIEAQVFIMAINGAMEDTPSPATLKKRLSVLVEKFCP